MQSYDLNANFLGKKEEYTNVLVSVSLIQQLPRHIVVFNNLHVVYSAAIDMHSLAEGIFPKPVISSCSHIFTFLNLVCQNNVLSEF